MLYKTQPKFNTKKNKNYKNESAAEISFNKPKDVAGAKNEENFPIITEVLGEKGMDIELPKI